MTTDTIKDKKLFYRHIIREFLDYDPPKGRTGTGKITSDWVGGLYHHRNQGQELA